MLGSHLDEFYPTKEDSEFSDSGRVKKDALEVSVPQLHYFGAAESLVALSHPSTQPPLIEHEEIETDDDEDKNATVVVSGVPSTIVSAVQSPASTVSCKSTRPTTTTTTAQPNTHDEEAELQHSTPREKPNLEQLRRTTTKVCRIQLLKPDCNDRVLVAIVRVLVLSGNVPATPKELVGMILSWGVLEMGGQTPQTTISSRISNHFRRCAESNPPRKPVLGAWTGQGLRKLRYFVDYPGIPVSEVPTWRLEAGVKLKIGMRDDEKVDVVGTKNEGNYSLPYERVREDSVVEEESLDDEGFTPKKTKKSRHNRAQATPRAPLIALNKDY